MTRPVIIAGCGYTGERLAARLVPKMHVHCITRSDRRAQRLQSMGFAASAEDLGAITATDLSADAVVVYAAPPPAQGDRDTTLQAYLSAIAIPERFVYLSTSGVYGDCNGELVDELQPVRPGTARAHRRVAAERALLDWAGRHNVETVILRVAGIYGPGRLPIDRIRRGEPVLRPEDAGPGNRIHVEDLVSACERAATASAPPSPVNISDGNHLSSTGFIYRVAEIVGLAKPPAIALEQARSEFSPIRWTFLSESRRLDNRRMREQLGVNLTFGNPDDGIRASIQD